MMRNNLLSVQDWNNIYIKIDEKINEKISHHTFHNIIVNKIFYNENFDIELNKRIVNKIHTIKTNYIQNIKQYLNNDKETVNIVDKLLIDYRKNCENENKKQLIKYKQELLNESYFILINTSAKIKESELLKKIIEKLENELNEKFKKKIQFFKYSFYTLSFLNLFLMFFTNLNNPIFKYYKNIKFFNS